VEAPQAETVGTISKMNRKCAQISCSMYIFGLTLVIPIGFEGVSKEKEDQPHKAYCYLNITCLHLTNLFYPFLIEVSQIYFMDFIILLLRATFFCASILQAGATC
jgi:hypothetical protein